MFGKETLGEIWTPGNNYSRLPVGQGKTLVRELAKRNQSYLPKSGMFPYGPPLHGWEERDKGGTAIWPLPEAPRTLTRLESMEGYIKFKRDLCRKGA